MAAPVEVSLAVDETEPGCVSIDEDPYSELWEPQLRVEAVSDQFHSGNGALHFKTWNPPSSSVSEQEALPFQARHEGVILIVHGYGEHSDRYNHVGSFFARQGYTAVALSHAYHGKSYGGPPCSPTAGGAVDYYASNESLLDDLCCFIQDHLQLTYKDAPHFVFAHSMGACLTMLALDRLIVQPAAVQQAQPESTEWVQFKAVMYSGPMLTPADDLITAKDYEDGGSCFLHTIICLTGSSCCSSCRSGSLGLEKYNREEKSKLLVSYPAAQLATLKDVRFAGWETRLRVASNHLTSSLEALRVAAFVNYPFGIVHAPRDRICLLAGSQEFMARQLGAPNAKGAWIGQTPPALHTDFKEQEHELHNGEDYAAPLELAVELFHRSLAGTDASAS